MGMREQIDHESGKLSSWKDIASYIGVGVRQAIRYADAGMPVLKLGENEFARVTAFKDQIDEWFRNRDRVRVRVRQEVLKKKVTAPSTIGVIYYASAALPSPVKIGFTTDARQRLRAIQTDYPYELEFLATRTAPACDEKSEHQLFDQSRTRGEWFNPTPDLIDRIICTNLEDATTTPMNPRARWIEELLEAFREVRATATEFSMTSPLTLASFSAARASRKRSTRSEVITAMTLLRNLSR